jgi:beta-N-acetylhexosaminidase
MINDPSKLFEKYGGYEKFLEKYPVGGMCLGGDIVGGPMGGAGESFHVVKDWESKLKVPPAYFAGYEPNFLSLAATGSKDLAYKLGIENAKGLKQKLAHSAWNMVCDMMWTDASPISTRSMGDDPVKCADLLVAFMKGCHSEHIVPQAKHYPGLGKEWVDTHIAKVQSSLTKEEWDRAYRYIYKKLIDNGLMAVMTAHVSLPCYQSENERDEYGNYLTATHSKELITGLLKNDLGFKGVAITDGLIMGGNAGGNVENAVKAFEAGHDFLCWPDVECIDAIEEKILNGEIPMSRLEDALDRIKRFKEFCQCDIERDIDWDYKTCVSQEIARKSMTLLNNHRHLLPLDKEKIKKVFLVKTSNYHAKSKEFDRLVKILEDRGMEVITREAVWIPEVQELEKDVDLTIFAIFEGATIQPGPIALNGDAVINVWGSQAADPNKTIIANFGTPFTYTSYYKTYPTVVNAYGLHPGVFEAFVEAIFGEIGFEGKTPVTFKK